ncbi:MAG: M23 family metallopeptidase [Pseudomonadota bacterium]
MHFANQYNLSKITAFRIFLYRLLSLFLVFNMPFLTLKALAFEDDHQIFLKAPTNFNHQNLIVQEGAVAILKIPKGTKITLDGQDISVTPDGLSLIGWGFGHGQKSTLKATFLDGTQQTMHLSLKARDYTRQYIDNLEQSKVTPPTKTHVRIKREAQQVQALRLKESPLTHWREAFQWPCEGVITGIFGSQRILNSKPRAPHYGYDIAAPLGTPIYAPAGGKIIMAEQDLYFSGATMMIDHGYGLVSAFLHLKKFNVHLDQSVKKGQLIGWVGSSGRSTGPHLDWRVSWFTKRLDAALLISPSAIKIGQHVNPQTKLE